MLRRRHRDACPPLSLRAVDRQESLSANIFPRHRLHAGGFFLIVVHGTFDLGSGRPASMADSRQLRPDALNCVADPAAGLRPEAPRAIVAALTAPSACGHRSRSTRTTDSFRFPPSTWPAGQSERLAITLGIRLGHRASGLRWRRPAN